MFLVKVLALTLIFYLVFNFSKLGKGIFSSRDFILPFSLGLAVSVVDSFLKAAFVTSFLVFILLFAACFGVLRFITYSKK